jgi:TolB-like protein/DNA-binding winged helix-turn-helix (wHTH) protein/Flp pilus assembly protein TadD
VSVLRFSVFEFDASVPELRRNGRRVHLQDMPLRVLEILLEHPNELVRREVFFVRLWPHDESGILDDNLNTAVRKLRLALTDSAHHPRFLETIPKRGYRFVARVEPENVMMEEPPDPPDGSSQSVVTLAAARALSRNTAVSLILVLAAIAATLFLAQSWTSKSELHAGAQLNTLAVLPFVNASGQAQDEYFSHGLTEELMDRLSRSGRLRVVSRTSTFAIKDKELGAQEIGRLLGAESLVEGSVRRDGDRLRINVRLINARDGFQLWSDLYDRRMGDLLQVQEEIASSIANTLTGQVLNGSFNAVREAGIADPLAYDLYLKGRFYWQRRTQDGLRSAVEHFEQAVQRSPEYARAWAGLADAYAVLGFYDYLAPAEAFPKAREAATRALELDPSNASAQAALGYVSLYYEWDLVEAEKSFRRSIALDPSYSKSHQWYGNLLTAAGRLDEAEREMRLAQQLEPLSLIASAALGWALYHAGRHEDALAQYQLTLALDPNFELAYLWRGWALEALGRLDEAETALKEALARSNGNTVSVAALARIQALRGEHEIAKHTLLELQSSNGYVPAYEISKAWFALGDMEQANAWLQKAYEQRSHSLVFLHVDPQLAKHQRDAGFLRVASRVSAVAK